MSGTDREVAVLDREVRGHHLVYLRHLARALPPKGWTWVTSEGADRSEQYETHLRDVPPGEVVVAPGSRRAAVRAGLRAAATTRRRRLVIPEADHYLGALLTTPAAWTGSVEIALLVMRTPVTFGGVRHRLRMLAKRGLALAVALLPGVRAYFLSDAFGTVTRRRGYGRLGPVPDPVERAIDAPAPTDLVARTREQVVAVVGYVTARKNAGALLDGALLDGRTSVLLAGRLDDEVRAEMCGPVREDARADGTLQVVDRHLDREEFAAVLAAADAVAVLHGNDDPSGILAEAALRGTPSLVAAGGWLECTARECGLGEATTLEPRAVAAALGRLRANAEEQRVGALRAAERLGTADFVRAFLD